jgi:hypothetical protein
MSRQTCVTRDAQGNVTGSTEVRSSSGCGGCFWLLLGADEPSDATAGRREVRHAGT